MDVGHSNNRTDMFYQFYPQKMSSFMWKLNEIDDQLLDHQLYLIFRQSHIRQPWESFEATSCRITVDSSATLEMRPRVMTWKWRTVDGQNLVALGLLFYININTYEQLTDIPIDKILEYLYIYRYILISQNLYQSNIALSKVRRLGN